MNNIFFIIGSARSGTTAVAKILNISTNSRVFIEQEPRLCIEARTLYKKNLEDPTEVVKRAKENYIKTVTAKGLIYGDKNPNYLPFVPYLDSLWQPKFIFVVRDGRDVVRSLMDWHKVCQGNIFGMDEDENGSTITSPQQDWWDYSRLRPNPGEPYFKEWKNISRFEKCCWYWNEFNALMFMHAVKIDKKRYRLININKTKAPDFKEIFDFLGIKGFNLDKVGCMLSSKINRAKISPLEVFPYWKRWDADMTTRFNTYARETMKRLGYY